jgi:hypothetical protein
MTTSLRKPVARELVLDDVPFKVVISPQGVRITPKGRRKGAEVSWETILRLSERDEARPADPRVVDSGVPNAVVTQVAKEVSAARAALVRAEDQLKASADLPPGLRREMEPDPVYGPNEQRSDWFIEPLLTPAEVASVLRLSTSAVARLPIRWISLAGERRYRQSEIRQYLAREERAGAMRW